LLHFCQAKTIKKQQYRARDCSFISSPEMKKGAANKMQLLQ